MRRLIAHLTPPTLVALLLGAITAYGGSSTVNYNSTGAAPFATTTDGSGNNYGRQTIWDSAAAANGLGITANNAAKMEGVGTAGSATGGILTVQGVASMTPFLTNPGTAANWGIGATGSGVPANGVYIGTTSGGNLTGIVGSPWGSIPSGNAIAANVNCLAGCGGSGGTASTFNAAFPSQGTAIGINNGTNMVGWIGDATSGGYVQLKAGAIADGGDITQGSKADTAWVSGSGSIVAILKNIANALAAPILTQGAINVTPTDCSASITAGGTAQFIISTSTTLHGFTLANIDATAGSGEPVWMSFNNVASASTLGSYPLAAPTATTFAGLASYTTPPGFGTNHAVSVVAATTGHKVSCTQW